MSDTSVATRDNRSPLVVLRERLEARRDEIKNALMDIDPDHFIRAVTTAAQTNSDILACSFPSLWIACMKACRDNLLPDGREGAIVPYKSNATSIPMYQGLLKRFRQSGMAKWITSNVVREGETFEHWIDQTGEHFKHIPEGDEKAPIVKVYAAALTTDNAFYVAVMSISEINKIKSMSRASRDDSPWKMWEGEMMKKTALRRLSKLLPAGRDFFEDDDADAPLPQMPTPTIQIVERDAGAAAALKTFAGGDDAPPTEGGGEVVRTADPVTKDEHSPISIAYERGRIAKQTGGQRRAIPGEYREPANKVEADAWYAGYDGKEMPDGEATN